MQPVDRHPSLLPATAAALVLLWSAFGAAAQAREIGAELVQARGSATSYWDATTRQLIVDGLEHPGAGALNDVSALNQLTVEPSTGRWSAVATRTEGPGAAAQVVALRGDLEAAEAIAPARSPFPRSAPSLLSGNGLLDTRPATLAWLEGSTPRQHEIRVARWNGTTFEEPELLVAAAAGSQVGLQGVELADGRQLLVWAAFDGNDTELMMLIGERDDAGVLSWSKPHRLTADNQVPDVTPTLAALPDGGAVVAWSTFDDTEYRSVVAHLAAGANTFSAPKALGRRGLLRPQLHVLAGGSAVVSLLDARTATNWQVVSLDRRSGGVDVGPRASLKAAIRPLIASVDERGIEVDLVRHDLDGAPSIKTPRGVAGRVDGAPSGSRAKAPTAERQLISWRMAADSVELP